MYVAKNPFKVGDIVDYTIQPGTTYVGVVIDVTGISGTHCHVVWTHEPHILTEDRVAVLPKNIIHKDKLFHVYETFNGWAPCGDG